MDCELFDHGRRERPAEYFPFIKRDLIDSKGERTEPAANIHNVTRENSFQNCLPANNVFITDKVLWPKRFLGRGRPSSSQKYFCLLHTEGKSSSENRTQDFVILFDL